VEIPVTLDKIPDGLTDIAAFTFTYTYDTDVLSYKETKAGVMSVDDTTAVAGKVSWFDKDAPVADVSAELFTLVFDIADATAAQTAKQNLLVELSEKIGGHKSKSDYERQRKAYKTQRDTFLKNAETAQAHFGDAVLDMFPQLLISKAVADAKKKIHLKVEQQKLPGGVNKKLINYLLSAGTTECVCGRPLCAEERTHIEAYLSMLPPKSFSSLYQEFSNTARIWGKGYDKSRIEAYIMSVLENNEQASECDNRVRELDEAEKVFVDYIFSDTGRAIVEENGYIPAF
jgi:hypothetical protein